jgi:MFS family permease
LLTRYLWRDLPAEIAAALDALRFDGQKKRLPPLDPARRARLLSWCDRNQVTLFLGHEPDLPEWAAAHAARRRAANRLRVGRARAVYAEISRALDAAGAGHLMLKGFTHWGRYLPDPVLRVQYDLDLYCPPHSLYPAQRALEALGYRGVREMADFPTDHLPVMVRKTAWSWRGDYYDPEIPFSVDLHFRFWDERTERLEAPGTAAFWDRRVQMAVPGWEDAPIPSLCPADGLAYVCLHLLRHLLRASVRPAHVYELAWFLHHAAGDAPFWEEWLQLHPPRLRMLQGLAFRLAAEWFGCRTSEIARREMEAMPSGASRWFETFAASPLVGQFRPLKDELWLHLALVHGAGGKTAVAVRRLFPTRLPRPGEPPEAPRAPARFPRVRAASHYSRHLLARAGHHARALASFFWRGLRWKTGLLALGRDYHTFLFSSLLFNLGLFVIVLLYNLHLAALGFREDAIGRIAAAHTAGSVAGILPAAWIAGRLGPRASLALCFSGVAAFSVLRAIFAGEPALITVSFLAGASLSLWPVTLAPAVTRLTVESTRPLGFSLFFAAGIGTGVAGGLLGGQLPAWLGGVRNALFAASACAALALFPLPRIAFAPSPAPAGVTIWPGGTFAFRFFAALAVWNAATGAFNPFFNIFFSRHLGVPVGRIGVIYSAGQAAQVAAILLAPAVLRRLGVLRGIAAMQAATACALLALAFLPPGIGPPLAYAAFMACQYMSEPGMYALLMDGVAPEARTGA